MQKKLPLTIVTNRNLLHADFSSYDLGVKNFLHRRFWENKVYLTLLLLFSSITSFGQMTTQNFESGIPNDWTLFNNGVGTSTWTTTTDGYLGSNAVSINPSGTNIASGAIAEYYIVTPVFNVPENAEIRFFTKRSTTNANPNVKYQIRLSTANQPDINGFSVLLNEWDGDQLNVGADNIYEEKIIEIPSSISTDLNIFIAFVAINSETGAVVNGDTWFVDNVRVIEGCFPVVESNFTVSNITTSSANLAWTHLTATDFEIQVVPQGQAPATTGISVSNSHIPTNLTADTNYDVYIRTVCATDTKSSWAGPFDFKTSIYGLSCDTPIVIPNTSNTYLFSSNLDLFAANPTPNPYTTQGTGCLPAGVTGNFLNGSKAFFTYTPTENGLINIKQVTLPWSTGSGCFGNAISGVFVYEDCASVGVTCLAGLNTTSTNAPKYINNLYVEAGHTYTIVISSSLASSTSICFNFELTFTTCGAPNEYSFKNLLQESLNISWNNPANLATQWEYIIQPAGTGIPTGSGTTTTINTDLPITGLTAGTAYELYVRSVCSSSTSQWGAPFKFTTQCPPFATPYHTLFPGTNATNPQACWTSIDVNGDGTTWSYLQGWEDVAPNYATLLTNTFQNNNNDILASAQIIFDGPQKRLRYKHSITGGSLNKYMIKLSTTGVGADNFSTIIMPETAITNTTWQEKIINLPTNITGNVNIAWVVIPGTDANTTRISITDVYIEDKPACPDPIAPTGTNVTSTTAELSWTIGETETQWQVAIQPLNSGIPTGDGVLVSSNPYIAENLNPATRYEYYVRAYCNTLHQSNWVGPFLFTTDCIAFDTPYIENFNDDSADTKKFCWTIVNANNDGAAWIMEEESVYIQPLRGWFNSTTSFDDYLISPAIINPGGNKEVKFDYRAAYSMQAPTSRFGFEVLISTTDTQPSSFTVLEPLMVFTNTDFEQKSIYIQETGVIYIALRVPPEFSLAEGASILEIDNFSITDAPNCPNPTDLNAANILQNQAELSWVTGFQETAWNVVVQTAGSGVPTTTGNPVTNTTYIAEGLSSNTAYEFYVKANCTSEGSEWVGPFAFRTLCEAFSTPFFETFDSNSVTEDCWRIVNANLDGNSWSTNVTVNPYAGDQMAGIFSGSNGANNDWLISPTVTITDNQRLRFFYKVYNESFIEDLDIKLSTTGINPASFTTTLYTTVGQTVLINNVEYKEMVINFPTGIVGNINVAWHIPTMPPNAWGYRGQLLFIDNVIIENIPACAQPTNINVVNLTDTTVELGWTANGTETSWEISMQPFGTTAPVGDTLPEYLYTATTNPFTVNNLTAASKYEYYVRAICSETLESEWVGPFELTTKCSFDNLCEYTVTLSGGPTMGIGGGINVIQNGFIIQTLNFPTTAWNVIPEPLDFTLYLCSGVEFSLFWDSIGSAPGQYPGATVTVKDPSNNVISSTDLGLLERPRSTFFTGLAICGTITCPQPTNLAVNQLSQFSWTAGATETQWEVAIQPVGFNTIPQSGTIVTTTNYTPTLTDFFDSNISTYEYFVRAICSETEKSYWSGPKVFVRNDDASTALRISTNSTEICETAASQVTFNGATASADTSSCGGVNSGDIWFEFIATSRVHIIEANGFTGNFYQSSGDEDYPDMTMTLYQVTDTGLVEKKCSSNNTIVAMYQSELVVGSTYKVRLTLHAPTISTREFNVCITTPNDLCKINAVNYGFENPPMQHVTNVQTISSEFITPGWRVNLDTWDAIFFIESLNAINSSTYAGGQAIQVLADPEEDWDPTDPNIKGIYQEFDTSEITVMNYSFAHTSRTGYDSIQLYAGPPTGPFTLVTEEISNGLAWTLHEGKYNVPQGQNVTRFIFRSKGNAIGNLLDEANFTADIAIKSASVTLNCDQTSATLEAEGIGTWEADTANPATTIISDATAKVITVSGFNTPGVYSYHWKTRYCTETVTVTYNGFSDVPTVTSPVEYCLNVTATPLTAIATDTYTLMYYTEEVGGTGVTTLTPLTNTVGATTYYVSNVNANGCEGPRVAIEVVVNEITNAVVQFSYEQTYCNGDLNDLPTLAADFTTGGTFTSTTGLDINTATGEINMANTTPGTYVITYKVNSDDAACLIGNTAVFTVTIIGEMNATIENECQDGEMILTSSVVDNSFNPNDVNYIWTDASGNTVGSNSETINVSEYVALNPTAELPFVFTLTIDSNGCTFTTNYTVDTINCLNIPKGISPNGDSLNDNFELTFLNVRHITIFNRYGTEVYAFKGRYTNQWHGQDNKGNDLPVGTYFYSLTTVNGTTTTGWVYINR